MADFPNIDANDLFSNGPRPEGHGEQTIHCLAKFRNLAEAGFFAHELQERAGIPSEIRVEDDFDAISGHWISRFSLVVPQEETERAQEALESCVRQGFEDVPFREVVDSSFETTFADQDLYDGRLVGGARREAKSFPWFVIVAFGSVAIVAVTVFDRAVPMKKPKIAAKNELFEVLSDQSTPWFQSTPDKRGFRLLRFDPELQKMVLEQDLDGDGVYESSTLFE